MSNKKDDGLADLFSKLNSGLNASGNGLDIASSLNRLMNEKILLPNIPLKVWITEGKGWETLYECDGWRLQQQQFTRHCRILDPENVRRAWGTKNGMKRALQELLHSADWQKKKIEDWRED